MTRKNHEDNTSPPARNANLSAQAVILAAEAIDGSEIAFNQLVDLFQDDVFKMVYYRTLSRMDAEDITQNVFIKAFKKVSGLKSPEQFKSWLFSIALNQTRDFYRKKKLLTMLGISGRNEEYEPDSEKGDTPDPLDDMIRRDFWKHVGLFLDKLPGMEREVFTLRFMDHLAIQEIGDVLGKRESTVKTHLYRALEKFRKETKMRQFLTGE